MKKLFKNLMLFCLLTVGVCLGFTTLSYGQAVVSVDPPQLVSPSVGQQLTIDLKITNARNVAGYQVTVNFDSTALRYVSSEYADYLPAGAFAVPPAVSGSSVRLSESSLSGAAPSSSGTLATVTFEVVASKTSTVRLTGVVLADSNSVSLPVSTRNGTIQVGTQQPFAQEWSYKDRFIRHTGLVRALAFSPNGQMLASGGADSVINLLNPVTGGLLRSLRGHTLVITSVAFSKDGRMLASSSADGDIRLWNPQTGSLLRTILGAHRQGVQSIDFSPDGRFLASGGRDNTTCLWNTQTGGLVIRIPGQTDWVLDVAFSADGRLLASASRDRTIRLRNSSGNFIRSLQGHTDFVTSVAFAPTGELVSGSRDLTVRSWNPETGSPLRVFRGHTHHVNHVSVSLDGTIASGSTAVRLWDLQTGESVGVLNENLDGVRVVAFSADGLRLASGDESGSIVLYESVGTDVIPDDHMDDGIPDTNLRPATADFTYKDTFVEDAKPVRALAFSPIGIMLASGGYNRAINLWNAATGQLLETVTGPLKGHTRSVTAIAFSPSDPLMLASSSVDGSIRLWNSIASQHLRTIDSAHPGGVQSVAFSPDGRLLASGGRDNTGRLWDPETGSLVATLPGHTDWVLGVAFSADGRLLASASRDRTIRLWSSSGQYLRSLRGHTDFVTSVAFASTGELVSGSRDLTVRSWNPETGTSLRVFRGHTHHVNAVSVSVDGTIASGATTVHLWDLQTGQPLGTLDENPDGVRAVAFSPGGHWLASGDESGNVVLYQGVGAELEQPAVDTDYVYMPDPNLRSIINAALGKGENESIAVTEIQTLTELKAEQAGIEDLTGLESATNLTGLYLGSSQIADVSPLSGLIKLTKLELSYNQIVGISPLKNLSNLIELDLSYNQIANVSALANLSNLVELNLSYNQIVNVSALRNLSNLVELNLSYNQIVNVSALRNLSNLVELNLSYNQIVNVSALRNLSNLVELNLSYNQIVNVSPLAQLKQLKTLYLSNNQILDFSPIATLVRNLEYYDNAGENVTGPDTPVVIPDSDLRAAIEDALGKAPDATITRSDMQTLTSLDTSVETFEPDDPRARPRIVSDLTGIEFAVNLTKLDLPYSALSDISVLSSLKNLTHLDLLDNRVSDISALAGLKNLTYLNLPYQYISDISVLAGLKNLTHLNLRDNKVSDISALSGLRNLTSLYLQENEVSDVSALSGMTNLEELNLRENQLSDISVLSGLRNLTHLGLSDNKVSNISALSGLRNLTSLSLTSNQLSDISVLSGLRNLTRLYLDTNEISDVSALSGLTSLTHLNISFNEISDVSALSGLTSLTNLILLYNQIVDFAPIAEVVGNLDWYVKDPQLKSLIPHSVELSGPRTVASVVRDYTFTAKVTNAAGQGLKGVEVKVNGDETVRTNSRGEAQFSLNFPSMRAYDISVTVRDEESGTEFQKHFPSWVEVLKPHSIELVNDRREIEKGAFYTADFVVKSVDGRALEGFQVKLSVGKWVFEKIGAEEMIVPLDTASPSGRDPLDFFTDYDKNARQVLSERRWNGYLVSPVHSDGGVELVLANFDIFGWRGSSVPSNRTNIDSTDSEGKARCSQRLLSEGQYGVSATVLLNSKEFLTTSFSTGQVSNKTFINPGRSILNESGVFYYRVLGGWRRVINQLARFSIHSSIVPPVDPPAYRVKVVLSGPTCGAVAPSIEILSAARKIYDLAPPPEIYYSAVDLPSSPQIGDEPKNSLNVKTTSSLHPSLRWSTKETQVTDVGIPVITVRFLDGLGYQKDMVKECFERFRDQSGANFDFRFTEERELSDIRVTFKYSKKGGQAAVGTDGWVEDALDYMGWEWLDRLGAALFDSGVYLGYPTYELEVEKANREFRRIKDDATFSINSEYMSVCLHEVGHALGFSHTHQTSLFAEAFVWPPKDQKGRDAVLKKYEEKWAFEFREVPSTASVDPESVMTYHIPPESLTINPKATSDVENLEYLKSLTGTDATGIPALRDKLSDGDIQALKNVYGVKSETSKKWGVKELSGHVSIYGVDNEWPFSNETISVARPVTVYVGHQEEYSYSFLTEFKWGGECRVEVEIGARRVIDDGDIEMAARVKLFEGWHEETRDQEDEKTVYFLIDEYDGTTEITVENRGRGGGDYATVTIDLSIPLIATSLEPLAPILASSDGVANSDVNSDGQVDVEDLILVSNAMGKTNLAAPRLDVNRDGIVTIADLVQVAQYLGQSTHASAPAQVVVPEGLTYATVEEWIDNARAADDGSLVFRQGIAKLEYLLTLIIPEKMALLHNYPNPFNPETWIPYHLSEPADVTLTIYGIDGKVVRHLDLGHQAAGYYQNKSRAAHWDGRNNVGERVASGIYFYTITAGDFAATRKMLILK